MRSLLTIAALGAAAATAAATPILVEIQGEVWGNQIPSGILGGVTPGEGVTVSFLLDSDDFLDSASFPTRGYAVDLGSFQVAFSGGASIGLAPDFAGPAYFVVRDNDPAVDGFFFSVGTDFPTGFDLDQVGSFGNFAFDFSVTYLGDTLGSLDIVGAEGDYDYDGLTSFNMGIGDGPFESVLGIDFVSMSITVIPAPSSAALLALGAFAGVRRRR